MFNTLLLRINKPGNSLNVQDKGARIPHGGLPVTWCVHTWENTHNKN